MSYFCAMCFGAFVLLTASNAVAIQIMVYRGQPGEPRYLGHWIIVDATDWNTSPTPDPVPVELAPNRWYRVHIGGHPTSSHFNIRVSGGGQVTSQNTFAATGGDRRLRFITKPIKIYRGQDNTPYRPYKGRWEIVAATNKITNPTPTPDPVVVDLVTALKYTVRIGENKKGTFAIRVTSDGYVLSEKPGAATHTPRSNILRFRTQRIHISRGQTRRALYQGAWSIFGATGWFKPKPSEPTADPVPVDLVADLDYTILIGGANPEGTFGITVAADGLVTTHNRNAASDGMKVLKFKTARMSVKVLSKHGWVLFAATSEVAGSACIRLVCGLGYRMDHNDDSRQIQLKSGLFGIPKVSPWTFVVGGSRFVIFRPPFGLCLR